MRGAPRAARAVRSPWRTRGVHGRRGGAAAPVASKGQGAPSPCGPPPEPAPPPAAPAESRAAMDSESSSRRRMVASTSPPQESSTCVISCVGARVRRTARGCRHGARLAAAWRAHLVGHERVAQAQVRHPVQQAARLGVATLGQHLLDAVTALEAALAALGSVRRRRHQGRAHTPPRSGRCPGKAQPFDPAPHFAFVPTGRADAARSLRSP